MVGSHIVLKEKILNNVYSGTAPSFNVKLHNYDQADMWNVRFKFQPDRSQGELFNRVDSDRTRDHSLRLVKTVARQEIFTQRVVNVWNGFPGKVVAAETVDKFKLELDRYLEVMEIEGYGDVVRTFG